MNDNIVFRSLTTTTAIALGITVATRGPNAGITWWLTLYATIYPFVHLSYRATNSGSKLVTYLAIIHYRLRGQYPPCRHCLIEYQRNTVPRYLWHTCDRCDWGNE